MAASPADTQTHKTEDAPRVNQMHRVIILEMGIA